MEYNDRYDDPVLVEAFVARLNFRGNDSPGNGSGRPEVPNGHLHDDITDQIPELKSSGGTTTPTVTSAASSPPKGGLRAPPPTPESAAVKATELSPLPAINEDEHDHQTHAHAIARGQESTGMQFSATARTFEPASAIVPDCLLDGIDDLMENGVPAQNTRETVNTENDSGNVNGTVVPELIFPKIVAAPATSTLKIEDSVYEELSRSCLIATTEPFPDLQDESTAICHDTDSDDSSVVIIVDAPRSPESFRSKKSVVVISSPEKEVKEDAKVATVSNKNAPNKDQVHIKEEPRKDANYFSTWGAPPARTTGPARVRKVIISNLPSDADYTLVQSLIHGGSIETMSMFPTSTGSTTAYITFTNADACDTYSNAYPKGLSFKHQGKKHVVFVSKGKDVDVVSSIAQSYLDCGASRVVKVVGADEEWSMKALYKVAEELDGRRKVEAILDTYRNESRTITFRFTKIADAVAFRGNLRRCPDWEDTDVQFASDPCEKATGFHQE